MNFEDPVRPLTKDQVEEFKLKYYNADIHKAAFKLPQFAQEVRNIIHLKLFKKKLFSSIPFYLIFFLLRSEIN